MGETAYTPEQQQLRVEMDAVLKSLGGGGQTDYEVAQGRQLIEKAAALGMPEESYADLRRSLDERGEG